jgi:16S rRNA (guanine966-N2)-methyltransferase
VRDNLVSVGLADAERGGDATVVRADAVGWVATTASRYDLALCDPPYDFTGWDALVAQIPADLAVLESSVELVPPQGWGVVKSRRYGSTIVTVARSEMAARKGMP